MATVVRKTLAEMQIFADAFNDLRKQIGAGALFHQDACEQVVAAATATDLPTSLTMCNQITAIYTFHMADTLAHKVTGVALASTANAVDLATAIAAANDIKAKFNTHIASTTFHYNADATNAIATANATILSDLITLLNATKTAFNAHMASAPASKALRVVTA
jgi:hypothetical protein